IRDNNNASFVIVVVVVVVVADAEMFEVGTKREQRVPEQCVERGRDVHMLGVNEILQAVHRWGDS
ncbi:hypothetical protein GW17_00005715, partial [Ensete ventricosum]